MQATCRELSAQIAKTKSSSTRKELEERLAAREKSHRDPLKVQEKTLRGRSDVTLRELRALMDDCEKELAQDDSVAKRVRSSIASKESAVYSDCTKQLALGKKLSLKQLEDLRAQFGADLDLCTSVEASDAMAKMESLVETRLKSHREPLEAELAGIQSNPSLKKIQSLKYRMKLELSNTDQLLVTCRALEADREANHKAKLIKSFKTIVNNLKKTKTKDIQELLKNACEELDENDALVSQIRSTLETKMMEEKGTKVVHNLDELEKGEREKVSDDLPQQRSKSKKGSQAKEEKSSKKSKSSSSKATTSSSKASTWNAVHTQISEVITGFRKDLRAPPPPSAVYKLGLISLLVLYAVITFFSTSLTVKVTKYDYGYHKDNLLKTLRLSGMGQSSSATAEVPPAQTVAPPAPLQQAAAAVTPAQDTNGASDTGGSGGGDDDDDDD